jgi:type VI secretion system protein ImpF
MIVLSVLNRLVDGAPAGSAPGASAGGPGAGRSAVVSRAEIERYRAAVRNDLEWLLNTRKIADPIPEHLKEVEKSVYCYGLPDLASLNLNPDSRQADQDRLAAIIARVIELFEPRILNVHVRVDPRPHALHDVHFQVSGRLQMRPRPEPVVYDAALDVTRGEYKLEVLGEGRA